VVVTAAASSYKGHRFPPEIIAHCVWLYHRFPLSFREVEELMLARGVVVSYETIVRHEVARDERTARMGVRMKG
jgi:putative transposase